MKIVFYLTIANCVLNSASAGQIPLYPVRVDQLGNDLEGVPVANHQRTAVAFNQQGTVLAVGDPDAIHDNNACGVVRVYQLVGTTWTQTGNILHGGAPGDDFGASLGLNYDGTRLVVGIPGSDVNGLDSGQVSTYKLMSGTWTPDAASLAGQAAGDRFGACVSYANGLAVGAPLNDSAGTNAGQVRIFSETVGDWKLEGIPLNGAAAGDQFGFSIAAGNWGNIIAVGAPFHAANGQDSGMVCVYQREGQTINNDWVPYWKPCGSNLLGEAAGDQFGRAIAAGGSMVSIGAPYHDEGGTDTGRVKNYYYDYSTLDWIPAGAAIDGQSPFDFFGSALALGAGGVRLAAGSPAIGNAGGSRGSVRFYEFDDTQFYYNQHFTRGWLPLGDPIVGPSTATEFGSAISLNSKGGTIAVVSRKDPLDGTTSRIVNVLQLSVVNVSTTSGLLRPTAYGNYSDTILHSYYNQRFPVGSSGNDIYNEYAPYPAGFVPHSEAVSDTAQVKFNFADGFYYGPAFLKYRIGDIQAYVRSNPGVDFYLDVSVTASYGGVAEAPGLLGAVEWYLGNWDFNSLDSNSIGLPIGEFMTDGQINYGPEQTDWWDFNSDKIRDADELMTYRPYLGFGTNNIKITDLLKGLADHNPNEVLVFRINAGKQYLPVSDMGIRTSRDPDLGAVGGPYLQVIPGNFTREEAVADAIARGGRLAVLDTAEKMTTATNVINSSSSVVSNLYNAGFWVGLCAVDSIWTWDSGAKLDAKSWATSQPDRGSSSSAAVLIVNDNFSWFLDDKDLTFQGGYLLEISMPKRKVEASASAGGYVTGGGDFDPEASTILVAHPAPGYLFDKWSGDSDSTDPVLNVYVNADKVYVATFAPDTTDTDVDGLTNYQESVTFLTDPLVADTDGDTYSDGYEVQYSSDPKSASSYPTYTLTLANNGTALGGTFAETGTLAHGTNATLTAIPLPGYLFGSWSGDTSGTSNPTTVLMDTDKTVGATFVEDTRDPDSDGLTNYQEIIAHGSNPDLADTDGDGLSDGEEITRGTNPLLADTDGDGLSDGEEITRATNPLLADTDGDGLGDGDEISITKTNPLLVDSNANGLSDSLEDTDGDGILSGREVNELGMNPLLVDTNANGLSDTYELLFQGDTEPFKPRVGDRVRYDFNRLGFNGKYSLVGKLPTGLTFNVTTGILEGKITAKAGTSLLTIQVLNGTTVVRSIPLSLPILVFPASLAGSWQALVENEDGQPEGMIRVVISSPGLWSASYDGMGTRTVRSSKGQLDLTATQEQATWNMTFPPTKASKTAPSLPAVTMTMSIDGATALAEGDHVRGSLRGFRLARGAELPAATKTFTLLIDHGVQDGFQIPAGMGTATGTLSNSGILCLAGQFGDAQIFKASFSLGATGQALIWLKPYKNVNSYIGGMISLKEDGLLPPSPLHNEESRLVWYRAADATELAYPGGFAALDASVGVREHRVTVSSIALSQNLGLSDQVIRGVVFDGGGLPDPTAQAKLPESFAIDAKYNLIALPQPGSPMASWKGLMVAKTGGFTGTLGVVASNTGIITGSAPVSGVLFPTLGSKNVGAGLVKIPISGRVGEFRTGAIILGADE